MGSLSDLVGDVFDLEPPLNVDPGTVLLTLKHGAPAGVVRPGRKLRRGKGLPLTLAPQGVAISTEDVPIAAEVGDIGLQGEYNLLKLELAITVTVDGTENFTSLQNYVSRKGLNFAALLDAEVGNELDKLVRDILRPYTAGELFELGNLTDLVASRLTLLDGLFRLESVQKAQPTWHPEFVRARNAASTAAANLAEKLLALEHAEGIDRQLATAHDQLMLEQALRRGVKLLEFENPELIGQASAQEHELKLELVRQLDALRRGGGTDVVRAALEMISAHGPTDPEVSGPRLTREALPAIPASAGWAMDSLERDKALARMWRKAGLPGEPLALAMSERADDVTVVIVCSDRINSDDRVAIEAIYRDQVDATEVVALTGVETVEDVVREFLVTCDPELREAHLVVELRRDGERVLVQLSSERVRLSPYIKRFNDPASSLMSPLTQLLDVDGIEVQAAESA